MTLSDFFRRHHLYDGDRIVIKGYIPERDEFKTLTTITSDSSINVMNEIPEWNLSLVATIHHENVYDEAAEDNLEYVMVTTETYERE